MHFSQRLARRSHIETSRHRWSAEPSEVEQLIGRFFGTAANRPQPRQGSIQLALDGKTLRGTIPKGESKGVHLLAIYHQPHRKLAGTSALPNDFRTARTV